jgi:hypothetical protein
MMFGLGDELRPPPVVTFVLRLWRAGGMREPAAFRYQTTHVQTGDVAYFGTIDSVMHHVQRLTEQLLSESTPHPPTPLYPHPRNGISGEI